MLSIVNALIPVLSLMAIGMLIRRSQFVADPFWPAVEKLTYYLFMPALLIHSLAQKEIGSLPWLPLLLALYGTILISAALLTLWWFLRGRADGGAVFTSVFQGGIRFNTFVALAVAEALFGLDGLLIAAIGAGFIIPLINVLCVTAFSLTVNRSQVSVGGVVLSLVTNPLIVGCMVGGLLNGSGVGLPEPFGGPLRLLGKAAIPLGLMAVGAAYNFDYLRDARRSLLVSCTVQFVVKPLVAAALAISFGLSSTMVVVVVVLMAVPTAPSAYILSRQLGGDSGTMASIITAQTLLSFITLPLTLVWIQYLAV